MKPFPTSSLPRGIGYDIWMQLSKHMFKHSPKQGLGAALMADAKVGINPVALKGGQNVSNPASGKGILV